MANFIDTPHGNTIAYNQFIGKKTGIVFLSGFKSDMKGNKALYLENWAKNIQKKIFGLIGLAAAPDFPKLLIWDKMNIDKKKSLIKNKKITISNNDGSQNIFSYKFIKDSFKNLVLSEDLHFDGPVYLSLIHI